MLNKNRGVPYRESIPNMAHLYWMYLGFLISQQVHLVEFHITSRVNVRGFFCVEDGTVLYDNVVHHSFCTMCCDAHVPIEVLMQWMGHSDDKMIRRIYDHVTDLRRIEAESRTASYIDQLICKGVKTGVN